MVSRAPRRGSRTPTAIPAILACGRRSRSIPNLATLISPLRRPPTTIMAVIALAAICSPIPSSAVDLETGKQIWHYQITHHDIWNYDLPSAPALGEYDGRGRPVKALVQLSKQGYAYVLDRVTGQPIWPIEERRSARKRRARRTCMADTAASDQASRLTNTKAMSRMILSTSRPSSAPRRSESPSSTASVRFSAAVGDQGKRHQRHLVQSRQYRGFALARRRLRS